METGSAKCIGVLRTIVDEHRLILITVGAYVGGGWMVLQAFQQPWPVRMFNAWFSLAWLAASVLALAWEWLRSPRRLAAALNPVRLGGAILVALLAVPFQSTFQALKQSLAYVVGFPFDPQLARIGEWLHRGPAWHLVAPALDSPALIRAVDRLYMAWFPALLVVLVWLSWTSNRALRARGLHSLLLLWIGAGTVGAWALASAGPCYSDQAAYIDLVSRLDRMGVPLWARFNQAGLWQAQQTGIWLPFGGVSAMPSMHVAAAVWMAIVGWKRSRIAGTVLAIYAVIVQLGSVILAWHYAIDGYAGALFAWAAWWASGRLPMRRNGRSSSEPFSTVS